MDVMGLIGTATGVVSLAILVAQEARHFGDMPAISSASSKYRTILENNGSADATDVLVIQRDMSEPRPDSPRWKFQAIRAHDSARLDDARNMVRSHIRSPSPSESEDNDVVPGSERLEPRTRVIRTERTSLVAETPSSVANTTPARRPSR